VDYLEGAFLVRRLPPFLPNLKKRLTKSPKYYWRDTGLLHALLRVDDREDLLRKPWVGASWEGFVIEQALGVLRQLDRDGTAGFFRTSDGYEADLVVDFGRELWAIEVKLTSQPSPSDLGRLDKVGDLVGATKRIVISQTSVDAFGDDRISCSLPAFLRAMVEGRL